MRSDSPFSDGLKTWPLGSIVWSWPLGHLVRLLDEQIAVLRSHWLMPISHMKAICLLLFMLLHTGHSGWPSEIHCDCSPSAFSFHSRWRGLTSPLRWHLLWSLPWVWAWSKGCCSFSSQTSQTNKSLLVLPCIRTDVAVPLFLQICNYSKLQLCGKYVSAGENTIHHIAFFDTVLFWEQSCSIHALHLFNT